MKNKRNEKAGINSMEKERRVSQGIKAKEQRGKNTSSRGRESWGEIGPRERRERRNLKDRCRGDTNNQEKNILQKTGHEHGTTKQERERI